MTKADDLNRVRPAPQHVLCAARLEPRDGANHFAGADIKRGDDRRPLR
jgi:hypothetical protein